MTIPQALDLAMQHHQAGRLAEAERIYRQILSEQPEHLDAMHYLGVVAYQTGRHDIAVDLIRRVIAQKPEFGEAYCNLGNALKNKGEIKEAIAAYRRSIQLKPDLPQACFNLGIALTADGQIVAAMEAYQNAIKLRNNYAEAHYNLAVALKNTGKLEEAIAAFREAVKHKPGFPDAQRDLGAALANTGKLPEAVAAYHKVVALQPNNALDHNNLGAALQDIGQPDQAVAAYQRAISLAPALPEAHYNLGNALREQGRLDEALAAYRQAIQLRPDLCEAHYNLGNTLQDKGQYDQAIAAFRQAVSRWPNDFKSHNNLGNALKESGQIELAVAAYRQALALRPDAHIAHSNLAFSLHFLSQYSPAAIAEEHRRWNDLHARPLQEFIQPHRNDRQPERRLKLGYVSPDFRGHPVGRFILPLLQQHDRQQFEIFCYSNGGKADSITELIRPAVDHWQEIFPLNDQQAADRIRADGIDILIDLSGHTERNRLLVFARKPAPLQVSYLGYPGTTGLQTIDYRLTDHLADPDGSTDSFYSETLYRLPRTIWCFAEPRDSPTIEPPPVVRQGHVTFGSFNNLAKVTEEMLQTWARILLRVSGSRLFMKAFGLDSAETQQRVRQRLGQLGIDSSRVGLHGPAPDHASHLAQYAQVDMALDSFPYNGTATTCDALWMGVPVITLAGQTHVSRVGLSLLTNIGLPELVTSNPEQYVQTAADLASDAQRIGALRQSMRDRMRASPLMDATGFARDVEAAYRQMWRTWCRS